MKLPEDPGRDFPFYQGVPVALTGAQWWLLLALVAVAFALLIAPIPWPGGELGAFVPAVLFPLIPLAGLAWVSQGKAGRLFGPVGLREIKLMILFALLNIAVTMTVGGIVRATLGAAANPAIATANNLSSVGLAIFLSKTAVQLVGEEVLTMIPLLAILHVLVARAGMGRSAALTLGLAGLGGPVRPGASADLPLGFCAMPAHHRHGAPGAVPGLHQDEEPVGQHGAHILNDWFLIMINVVGSKLIQP
jgi:hypothetical protein